MKTKIFFFAVIIIAVVLAIVFLHGEVKSPIETSTKFPYSSQLKVAGGDKPTSPMQGVLTILEKPLLNVPVPLVFSFKSVTPAPNTEVKIELPNGFELESGTPTWNGDLEMNEERKIEVMIKSTKVGYYRLSGSAISRQGESFFGDTAIIDIEITPDDAIAGSKPENNWYYPAQGQGLPMAQNNEQIQSELTFSNTPELGKNFTVTYKVKVTSSIKLPSQRMYLNLVFPQKAFNLISVQFPQGGETYQSDTQLSWIGNIDVNQTMEIVVTFEVVNVGFGTVYGSLNSQSGKGGTTVADLVVDVKTANLYVDKYGGKFTQ